MTKLLLIGRRRPKNELRAIMILSATGYGKQYYDEHCKWGLDYFGHGRWQEEYGKWLVGALQLRDGLVLDVGCAAGSIAVGLAKAGMKVHAIDLNNHTILLGREKFGELLESINVCDAINLHLFGDCYFDFIHIAQTAEHWRPDLVHFILRELFRVLKRGGLLFTAHDTIELYERQGRKKENEDPTHLCLWHRADWDAAFEAAQFRDVSEKFREDLFAHPLSYIGGGRFSYDWDWWVLERL